MLLLKNNSNNKLDWTSYAGVASILLFCEKLAEEEKEIILIIDF